jgi:hypothetical protein
VQRVQISNAEEYDSDLFNNRRGVTLDRRQGRTCSSTNLVVGSRHYRKAT